MGHPHQHHPGQPPRRAQLAVSGCVEEVGDECGGADVGCVVAGEHVEGGVDPCLLQPSSEQ